MLQKSRVALASHQQIKELHEGVLSRKLERGQSLKQDILKLKSGPLGGDGEGNLGLITLLD
jgi:methylglyoxal synthase